MLYEEFSCLLEKSVYTFDSFVRKIHGDLNKAIVFF